MHSSFAQREKARLNRPNKVLSPNPRALTHALEDAALVVQPQRAVELRDQPRVHDADAVVVDDGLETMRNAEQCLAFEAVDNCFLDLGVGLEVDRGRGFVADDDLGAADEGSGEREELSLAQGEV